ncbi:MAG: sigma-54 dependent transcriptional regulator [Bacteroidales bacterium]|nr:sigma-54 dependent transcriptional regulator [Bacteroidales bacterium]MDD4604618.1 sigma-54 dependent transcriptional regulator [Bacteroidales bacterium]
MSRILVIDDEKSIRNTLREILEYEKYLVDDAPDGIEGLQLVKENRYDAILCDIKMPRMDGLEVLTQVIELTDTPVIMISGHGSIDTVVEAIKKGAYDYISKPLDLNRLMVTLRNAFDRTKLVDETRLLKKKIRTNDQMIGESESMQRIREMIGRVAPTEARVLITGESGTGKELVARQLHALSQRSEGPFVEVNCAAIPTELIESNLFGHEKGSFTSAIKQHKGDFEQANGGTLFLDEIGDMSLSAQSKVLRALQENKITRVGGEKEISVDVRVIAATNKNLKEEIKQKTFREDLFHRLSVIIIDVPQLTRRIDDIPLLVDHFLSETCLTMGKTPPSITATAIAALQTLPWTGNIRELRNVVERLIILCDGVITDAEVTRYARCYNAPSS